MKKVIIFNISNDYLNVICVVIHYTTVAGAVNIINDEQKLFPVFITS